MSLEGFHLTDNEPIDISIIKRDFLKIYHQQGANLSDSNQNVQFIFDANNIYRQIGNSYNEFHRTVRNTVGDFIDGSNIRLLNNAFTFCFEEAFFINDGPFRPRT